MKKSGFDEAQAMISRLSAAAQSEFDAANKDNAELIVDTAKLLIPERSGNSRREIRNSEVADGAQLIRFGSKSKVIEGDKGPRPFVNPALRLTKKRRQARNRKALKNAVKKAT